MGCFNRFIAGLFAILLFTAAPGKAKIIIVPSATYPTIQSALNDAMAGDVIQVQNGVYKEKISFPRSGVPNNYITLEAFSGHSPIIDGTGVGGNINIVRINSRNYIRIKGFVIHNDVNTSMDSGSAIRVAGTCAFVEILDNYIHTISGADTRGITVLGNLSTPISNITIRNNEIYNFDLNEGSGIWVEGYVSVITIHKNRVHDITGFRAMGINLYGTRQGFPISGATIDSNEVYNCMPADSEALTLNGNVVNFMVTNNTVHHVNNIGIDFIGGEDWMPPEVARDGVCRGNRVYNAKGVGADPSAAGIYIDGGQRIVVENNVISDCNFGISVSAENEGIVASNDTVRNNIVYNNDKAGLVIGGSEVGNGRTKNCFFLNNVFYKNAALFLGDGEVLIEYAEDNFLRNNIFYCNSQNIMLMASSGNVNNTLDYNLWYAEAGANVLFNWNWDDGAEEYNSFTDYQIGTGQDANSRFENPQLLNPSSLTNPDFHIAATSSAKDHGDPVFIPGLSEVDIDGQSRVSGGRVDIGADEIQQNPTPPTAPSNLAASATNSSTINLSWNDNSTNETGFKIERKTGLAGAYQQIATVNANIKNYPDAGLTAGTLYYYRVRAYNLGGDSDYSTEANATTTVPPNAPSNLVATTTSSSAINLTWDDNSTNETGIKVERKTGAGGTYALIVTLGVNARSYSNTGLVASTLYYYRVQAFNSTDNSTYSLEANATTLANPNPNLALGKPTTTSATQSGFPGSNAVDGNPATYWRTKSLSSGTKAYITVDLGSQQSVGRVVVNWNGIYYAKNYQIEVSNQKSSGFMTAYTKSNGTGGIDNITSFTRVIFHRYIQLWITRNNSTDERVNEFEIYSSAGTLLKAQQVESSAGLIRDEVALAPNFPNPFNPTTQISYAVPNAMHVTLKIYNLIGEEAATLVNETREPGNYSVTFNASRLTSGVYFSVLQAGEVRRVRRLILMK